MGIQRNPHYWQFGLAVFGTLLWMFALVVAERVNALGWAESYRFIAGYVLGYTIAFSGFVFWEVVQGRANKFLDPHPIFRWLSYFMLASIFLFGLLSLMAEIFGNTNWAYNIGSLIGGLVVALGVIPSMEKRNPTYGEK